MASTPRLPERARAQHTAPEDFHVSELAADTAGSVSPFGPELEFPLPPGLLRYTHPGPENLPHLAGGH